MAYRTDTERVQKLLETGRDYKPGASLVGFVQKANLITTRVAACAIARGTPLTADELEMVERWVAAYSYTLSDRLYSSNSTGRSSASYVLDRETPNPYLKGALESDPSGCLKAILSQKRASGAWVGKTASEELTYDERN